MKTPFDAALRLRQREIDEMRLSISVEINQMLVLDQRRDRIDETIRAEREIASFNHDFAAEAFAARMRAQREAVCSDREASEARLMSLRAKAVEAYGSLGAISAAADRHREEALRAASVAEQNQIDDFTAATFTSGLGAARRRRSAQAADT